MKPNNLVWDVENKTGSNPIELDTDSGLGVPSENGSKWNCYTSKYNSDEADKLLTIQNNLARFNQYGQTWNPHM